MPEFENRNFKYLVENGLLAATTLLSPVIPEKYRGWINSRAAGIACQLFIQVADNILGSDFRAAEFHAACGQDYVTHQIEQMENQQKEEQLSLLLYRYSSEISAQLNGSDAKILANPEIQSNLGKDILHPESTNITNVDDLVQSIFMPGTNIPVMPGAVCRSNEERDRIVNLFQSADIPYIFKMTHGTDGNGIEEDLNCLPPGDIVIEEKGRLISTVSGQFINGFLGTLSEREKDSNNRWLGNGFPFDCEDLSEEKVAQVSQRVEQYTYEFAHFLEEHTGHPPVIFGLDFGVYRDQGGDVQLALIDPNIRMPGNIFMYYQKALIEGAFEGIQVAAMKSVLLYDEQVCSMDSNALQQLLEENELSLSVRSDEGIVLRINGSGSPEGVSIIVQDEVGGLTMLNIFGKNEEHTDIILSKYLDLIGEV